MKRVGIFFRKLFYPQLSTVPEFKLLFGAMFVLQVLLGSGLALVQVYSSTLLISKGELLQASIQLAMAPITIILAMVAYHLVRFMGVGFHRLEVWLNGRASRGEVR